MIRLKDLSHSKGKDFIVKLKPEGAGEVRLHVTFLAVDVETEEGLHEDLVDSLTLTLTLIITIILILAPTSSSSPPFSL